VNGRGIVSVGVRASDSDVNPVLASSVWEGCNNVHDRVGCGSFGHVTSAQLRDESLKISLGLALLEGIGQGDFEELVGTEFSRPFATSGTRMGVTSVEHLSAGTGCGGSSTFRQLAGKSWKDVDDRKTSSGGHGEMGVVEEFSLGRDLSPDCSSECST